MSELRIITMYKLCPVQAQVVQENAKRPKAGCNIQLIKMVQDIFSPCHLLHQNMIHIRKFTVMNILG